MKPLVYVFMVVYVLGISGRTVSDTFQQCVKDSNFNDCFKKWIEKGALLLANGDSQLNISAMNSYIIPYTTYNFTVTDLIAVTAKLKNTKFEEVGILTVEDAKLTAENLEVDVDLFHPRLTIQTEFEVDGRLSQLPVHIKALFKGKFSNIKSHYKIQLRISETDGLRNFTIDKLKVDLKMEDGSMNVVTDDPQQQPIADFLQNSFNDNSRQYLKVFSPAFSNDGDIFYRPIAEKLVSLIQPDAILP